MGKINKEQKKSVRDNKQREAEKLIIRISEASVGTLTEKVAWILNHYPEARDSDITCQIKYWETFESEYSSLEPLNVRQLYKLARLTSIARARAKIQNEFNLFLASPEVRKQRGKLSEEEKNRAIEERPVYPVYTVYADESGKTQEFLIVGTLWIIDNIATLKLFTAINGVKEKYNYKEEIHFRNIRQYSLPFYLDVINELKEHSASLSFKALSVQRAGISDITKALTFLFYYVIIEGIKHENQTGRAPLPRSFQLYKDSEEVGSDKLMLAEIKDKLNQNIGTYFDNKLLVDHLTAVDSRSHILLQAVDLFTSSVNRKLNVAASGSHPKDEFADAFFKEFGITYANGKFESLGDCTINFSL